MIELRGEISYRRSNRGFFLLVAILSLLGFIYCFTEVILSSFGKSLCHSDTCQIVESFSLLPRPLLAAGAAFYFLLQGILAYRVFRKGSRSIKFLVFLAAIALGVECILVGRQFIDYRIHCPFCLTVALFTIISASLVLLLSKRLAVFGTVLGIVLALILTPISLTPLSEAAIKRIYRGNPAGKMILIYAENCPHCHEVLSFCNQMSDIDLLLCPKERALAFLRTLDIQGVPVLVVDKNGEKEVLIGSKVILSYLKSFQEASKPALPPLEKLLTPEGICSEVQKCEP
ncbi:MAG: hypothetical protein GXO20_06795 [Thermodesulfobacteria bacterium]|nr:hypothetical protein [Thermodesulfobacteriota bacterium]